MKKFFRLLFGIRPRGLAIEILQNGQRVFGATVRDLEKQFERGPPNANGIRANFGRGLQVRIHDLSRES